MARQRGDKWQGDALVNGKRVRRNFSTQAEAESFERLAAQGLPEVKATTFEAFAKEHFEFLWGDAKRPDYAEMNLRTLYRYIPGETPLTDITTPRVVALISALKKDRSSNATINRKLSTLSKIMKHAEKMEITKKPVFDYQKERKGRELIMTPELEKKAVEWMTHCGMSTMLHMFNFLLYTGCRAGEPRLLTRDAVSAERVTFHWTITKTSKTRTIPLLAPAKRAWDAMCRDSDSDTPFDAYPKDTFRKHWERMKEALGYAEDKEFVPHMLRHTCATRLVQKGIPLPQVMLWMGHTNISTTMRYSHLAPKDLDMAAKALLETSLDTPIAARDADTPRRRHPPRQSHKHIETVGA